MFDPKGTVSIMFKWPSIQRCQCPITTVSLKALYAQLCYRYQCFVSLNCLFSLEKWLVYCLFIRSNGETHWNKHTSSQKNEDIFNIFYQIKVSMVQLQIGIAIFAWKFTCNYAVSLFNCWGKNNYHIKVFRFWGLIVKYSQNYTSP